MNRRARGPHRRRRAVRGIHPLSLSAVGQEPAALDLRRPVPRGVLPGARQRRRLGQPDGVPGPGQRRDDVRGGGPLPASDGPRRRRGRPAARGLAGRRGAAVPPRRDAAGRGPALPHLAGGGRARGRSRRNGAGRSAGPAAEHGRSRFREPARWSRFAGQAGESPASWSASSKRSTGTSKYRRRGRGGVCSA